jgi:hypothetical protein
MVVFISNARWQLKELKNKRQLGEIISSQALEPGPAHPPITVPLEASVVVPLSNRSNSGSRETEIAPIFLSQQARVRHLVTIICVDGFCFLCCYVGFFARLSAFLFVSVGGGCGHCCRRCPCYGIGGLCPSAIPVARPGPGLRGSTRVGFPPICLAIMICGGGIA